MAIRRRRNIDNEVKKKLWVAAKMIYLQGNFRSPDTWFLSNIRGHYGAIMEFQTRKEARSWVIEELKRRAKELGRIKDRWMRDK